MKIKIKLKRLIEKTSKYSVVEQDLVIMTTPYLGPFIMKWSMDSKYKDLG